MAYLPHEAITAKKHVFEQFFGKLEKIIKVPEEAKALFEKSVTEIQKMEIVLKVCPKCGSERNKEAKFCSNCELQFKIPQ